MKAAMTVAGSDSGAGAGIQADIFAIASQGVFATSAVAALTAQNPSGVRSIFPISADFLTAQMESVCEYFKPCAAKCGMMFNAELVNAAADFFGKHREIKLVVDPVMISTSGTKLLSDGAVFALTSRLMPLAVLSTPNLDEACFLLNCAKIDSSNLEKSAVRLSEMLGSPVLLKGGHLHGDEIIDVLAENGEVSLFKSKRVLDVDTHGSGCTLSATIAARLALGDGLKDAVASSRNYLLRSMEKSLSVAGKRFINHFPNKK